MLSIYIVWKSLVKCKWTCPSLIFLFLCERTGQLNRWSSVKSVITQCHRCVIEISSGSSPWITNFRFVSLFLIQWLTEHSIKIATTWYLAVIKLNGRIALVKYGRSHPDILCDRKLCPARNWCQSLHGFACLHEEIRQSWNNCDLGMLELSLLLRN